MKRRYFGTDGVRGGYGGPVVNVAFARQLGAAVGRWFMKSEKWRTAGERLQVLIGRDTRVSGPAVEQAVAAGLAGEGFSPLSVGVLPTRPWHAPSARI